ncbi:hypothetical protein PaMx11_23 [Pseudomonas phage PaMx11]|uniref:Tail assembly chaperone n=1 Tax=Pseudomonas phage PaMx11 TaxID=1175657 RepID=A0A0S0N6W3_BPPAM|nr:hypothetical protein AVV52_gp23 [Pseudomonas phage PaMx11]ALH23697.1 hypothetical protein PaMx11_23 [Pseudomonas phage PaMx11]
MTKKTQPASAASGMEAFFTREKASLGVQLPLYAPTGEKTEHWLRIRGIDSDEFRAAEADARRDAMRVAAIEDLEERRLAIQDAQRALIATLVIGWSFEQECTHDNVMKFFREAPQIQDAVDKAASRRALFFANGSSDSPPSQSTSSA